MNRVLTIRLKSDLCVSSGDRAHSTTDTDVCFDMTGMPYIPGKRIKGILRENALEILSHQKEGGISFEAFEEIFGVAGSSEPGKLGFGSAYPEGQKEFGKNIQKTLGRYGIPEVVRATILESLTTLRKQTEISETGAAKDNSLRNIRVIRQYLPDGRELSFAADVSIDSPLTEQAEKLLAQSVRVFRNMGSERTRGIGEIRCVLKEQQSIQEVSSVSASVSQKDINHDGEELSMLRYTIRLKEPLITGEIGDNAAEIHDYIPGSMLLGVFAGEWLKAHREHKGNAHEDEEFAALFLTGEVRYGSGLLCSENKVLSRIPLNMLRSKDKKLVIDAMDPGAERDPASKFKHPEGYYAGGEFTSQTHVVSPKRMIFRHHSRPADRAIGSANGGDEGAYFQYSALDEGQVFSGVIEGPRKRLHAIRSLYESGNGTYRIGRSRDAQYGQIEMLFGETGTVSSEKVCLGANESAEVFFDSDTILTDRNGNAVPDPCNLLPVLSSDIRHDLRVDNVFLETKICSGFKSHWRLPLPQYSAVKMGSVMRITNISGREIKLPARLTVGLRTAEGYGNVVIKTKDLYPAEVSLAIPVSAMKPENTAEQDDDTNDAANAGLERVILLAILQKQAAGRGRVEGRKVTAEKISRNQLALLRTTIIRSDSLDTFIAKIFEHQNAYSFSSVMAILMPQESAIKDIAKASPQEIEVLKRKLREEMLTKADADLEGMHLERTADEKYKLIRAWGEAFFTTIRTSQRTSNGGENK